MSQNNHGSNAAIAAGVVAAAALYAFSGFSLASARDRHFVESPLVPNVKFAIDHEFAALPALSFPIQNLTNAEKHVFVMADESQRVERAIVIQFERVQEGSDFRFVYPSTPPEKLGFSAPRYWKVVRLARVADPKGKSEIIVFYMENADAAYAETGLAGADADGDLVLDPEAAGALLAHLPDNVVVLAD